MKPQCKITVDGKLVSGVFMERLQSCRITDAEGVASDSVSIELNDFPPASIPRKGAIIRVWMGYSANSLAFMGSYTADEVEVSMLPYSMKITGKGADLRMKSKGAKERHWDNKTLGDIIEQIAGENGLSAKVDSALASFKIPWIAQEAESDIHLIERLAQRHNALFSIKDGKLVFAEKGAGKNAGGVGLSAVVATPDNIVVGSARVQFSDRGEYKKVKARYYDRDAAENKVVEEESSDEGGTDYIIGDPFTDEAEAKAAAKATAKELKREAITASVTLLGDPNVRGGAPFSFSGVREGVDGIPLIIENAVHDFSKSGYTVAITAKLQGQGKSKSGSKPTKRGASSEPSSLLPAHPTLG